MGGKQIVGTAAQHPREPRVGRGDRGHVDLAHFLMQVRYPKLGLAKQIQLVFFGPVGGEKDAWPEEGVLQVTLHSNSADLSKGEIAKRGGIPARIVVPGDGHSFGEPPGSSNVETVCSKIPSVVSPSAPHLQPLSACSFWQQSYH